MIERRSPGVLQLVKQEFSTLRIARSHYNKE